MKKYLEEILNHEYLSREETHDILINITQEKYPGEQLAALSGYTLADVPYTSSFAGYKDWFISCFDLPGYTIEAGQGTNPLPLTDFDAIYRENLPVLVQAALL